MQILMGILGLLLVGLSVVACEFGVAAPHPAILGLVGGVVMTVSAMQDATGLVLIALTALIAIVCELGLGHPHPVVLGLVGSISVIASFVKNARGLKMRFRSKSHDRGFTSS